MSEEQQDKQVSADQVLQRSLTGGLVVHLMEAGAVGLGTGVGIGAGQQLVNQVINRPKDPPPPAIEVQSDYRPKES